LFDKNLVDLQKSGKSLEDLIVNFEAVLSFSGSTSLIVKRGPIATVNNPSGISMALVTMEQTLIG
jgi:hypothetical protein